MVDGRRDGTIVGWMDGLLDDCAAKNKRTGLNLNQRWMNPLGDMTVI